MVIINSRKKIIKIIQNTITLQWKFLIQSNLILTLKSGQRKGSDFYVSGRH